MHDVDVDYLCALGGSGTKRFWAEDHHLILIQISAWLAEQREKHEPVLIIRIRM